MDMLGKGARPAAELVSEFGLRLQRGIPSEKQGTTLAKAAVAATDAVLANRRLDLHSIFWILLYIY